MVPIVKDTINEVLSILNTTKVHRVIQTIATIGWHYNVRLVNITDNTQIEFSINSTSIFINGKEYTIDSNILQDFYDKVFHRNYFDSD